MQKITSFTIDHIKLVPGVYVSRKDPIGNEMITTFDLRMTSPNDEPVMNTAEMHAIEHLAATYLRNHKEFGPKIIYFGPMGCRTGFYLLLAGDYDSKDIVGLMIELFEFIANLRVEKIKKMLMENPDRELEYLSNTCGFSSSSHMSSTFKKITGETLNEFRKRIKNSMEE